ncbi:hypothetical protein KUTeg_024446 [Tegillarca granosa]|uniref:Uncharacterized protein n=1 Tax=Tegillarca granosa TaxID=220873 RepID=A0ABQ9E313_TEGGR|nr:hypothetical protein KUTeg_024446 [Tegillarca granosa]
MTTGIISKKSNLLFSKHDFFGKSNNLHIFFHLHKLFGIKHFLVWCITSKFMGLGKILKSIKWEIGKTLYFILQYKKEFDI